MGVPHAQWGSRCPERAARQGWAVPFAQPMRRELCLGPDQIFGKKKQRLQKGSTHCGGLGRHGVRAGMGKFLGVCSGLV